MFGGVLCTCKQGRHSSRNVTTSSATCDPVLSSLSLDLKALAFRSPTLELALQGSVRQRASRTLVTPCLGSIAGFRRTNFRKGFSMCRISTVSLLCNKIVLNSGYPAYWFGSLDRHYQSKNQENSANTIMACSYMYYFSKCISQFHF